jgi:hypothetical protein
MTTRAATALLASAAALASPRLADACSVCGCGDPLVEASDSIANQTPLRLSLDFEVLTASAASDENPLAQESLTQITLRPVVVYSPVESLNLVAQIPLVRKDWSLSGDEAQTADNTGIGDIDLSVRWFFLRTMSLSAMSRHDLGLTAGTTLPTGPNDASENGMRLDDHAQLGTGSFGPYFGATYAYHRDPWNLFVSGTAQVRTTNSFDYHYGSAVRWSVRGDYRIVERFAIELGLDGRYAVMDTLAGEDQVNTGGLLLAAAPGFTVNVADNLWMRGRVQIPFATSLNGDQSVGPTFFASVQMLIR